MNLSYIDIPLLFKAHYDLNESRLFGAVDPYVGFGFSGKAKTMIAYGGDVTNEDHDINWGNDKNNDDLKPFDMEPTFGAGIEYKSIMLGVFYDLGLMNISADQSYRSTIKTEF